MRDSDIDTLSADGAQDTTRLAASGGSSSPPGSDTPSAMTRQPGHADLRRLAEQAIKCGEWQWSGLGEHDGVEQTGLNPQAILALLDRHEADEVALIESEIRIQAAERRVAALEAGPRAAYDHLLVDLANEKQALALLDEQHPRTYSLVGSPHLFLVTDDESGINIGYADKIGGAIKQSMKNDAAERRVAALEAGLRALIEFAEDCSRDRPGITDKARALLADASPEAEAPAAPPAEPTSDVPSDYGMDGPNPYPVSEASDEWHGPRQTTGKK